MAALDALDAFDGHDSWDFREQARAFMAPADRVAAEQAQAEAVRRLESVPAPAPAGERRVSTCEPICNRCGRTRSEREYAYPFGWAPEREGMTEDEVPICCTRFIEVGNPDDKAMREIECLRWAKAHGWTPLPDPPVDPMCKFCKRLRGSDDGQCQRDVTTGSDEDRARRGLECSMIAAGL